MKVALRRFREAKLACYMRRCRNQLIVGGLALVMLLSPLQSERWGDRFQVALPLMGLGCAIATGGAAEYFLRFVAMEVIVHGTKNGLAETELNRRPNGGYRGMPSGHTAAASFGASALVQNCMRDSLPAQAAVIIAAGFTGASRIESGHHNIWQVLFGALVGWGTERAFRCRRATRAMRHGLRRYARGARALALMFARRKGVEHVEV